jgi:hypothetical protein
MYKKILLLVLCLAFLGLANNVSGATLNDQISDTFTLQSIPYNFSWNCTLVCSCYGPNYWQPNWTAYVNGSDFASISKNFGDFYFFSIGANTSVFNPWEGGKAEGPAYPQRTWYQDFYLYDSSGNFINWTSRYNMRDRSDIHNCVYNSYYTPEYWYFNWTGIVPQETKKIDVYIDFVIRDMYGGYWCNGDLGHYYCWYNYTLDSSYISRKTYPSTYSIYNFYQYSPIYPLAMYNISLVNNTLKYFIYDWRSAFGLNSTYSGWVDTGQEIWRLIQGGSPYSKNYTHTINKIFNNFTRALYSDLGRSPQSDDYMIFNTTSKGWVDDDHPNVTVLFGAYFIPPVTPSCTPCNYSQLGQSGIMGYFFTFICLVVNIILCNPILTAIVFTLAILGYVFIKMRQKWGF